MSGSKWDMSMMKIALNIFTFYVFTCWVAGTVILFYGDRIPKYISVYYYILFTPILILSKPIFDMTNSILFSISFSCGILLTILFFIRRDRMS